MKKRLWYGSAIVLLVISVVLVVSQTSFNLGQYGPVNPYQTFVFWAISSLIFVLMVTLGFILFRTAVKLYIERQSNREGSRIKTKLVIGALTLSFLPVVFLVAFSYQVLNRNLMTWFNRPIDAERLEYVKIAELLQREVRDGAVTQAQLLAAQPEAQQVLAGGPITPGFLAHFAKEQDLDFAAILPPEGDTPLDSFGPYSLKPSGPRAIVVRQTVKSGDRLIGQIVLGFKLAVDVAAQQAAIERYNRDWSQLLKERQNVRVVYLMYMSLITLFVLFVATWIALFLAKQISVPISALLEAAKEVRAGNLKHRVNVKAIDELALLVRGFNQMTQELEASSRELDRRRRFTEAILESIPTGVLSVDSDGTIRRVNRALFQIFPQELVSRAVRLEDLFSREDTAEIKYLMKRARRTGIASRQIELRTERQNLHLSVTVSALEEKLTSGFVIVLEDTSELLRAQKSAAWNEVARRVAHEMKNPLTPIALSAERIARQIGKVQVPPETARIVNECAETISKSVETVKTLVDEFSQFARFPSAQPARGDLNEVVEEALAVFAGRLDGIRMTTNLAPGLPAVNIDREQFKRVVVNLVDNAAEAMQDSLVRELDIITRSGAAETVELIIADTGCGVSAEDKEKLFLPYFSTKNRGTGLGLAIVNHILTDHGAQVRVEDNQPEGARFTIELAAIVEGEPSEAAPKPVAVKS
jgi:two-component system, NtrC family, nitrogen regulation sensor histidine kinase NtrY